MTSDEIRGSLVELAWSLWSELGLSGWGNEHASWLVDPEALIILTAWLGDEDARLRDEATDWCVRFAPMISASRLGNLQERASPAARERLGEVARAVSRHSSVRWNFGSAGASLLRAPDPFKPTGRSRLESIRSPAQLSLRLRAVFGVGARAEVMRVLLEPPWAPTSTADIAEETFFKKRVIATTLEMMHKGGVVDSQRVRKELRFQLTNAAGWHGILGPFPEVWPRWHHILPLIADMQDAVVRVRALPPRARLVELRILVDALGPRATIAHLPPLAEVTKVEDLERWSGEVVAALRNADASVFRDVEQRARALRDAM